MKIKALALFGALLATTCLLSAQTAGVQRPNKKGVIELTPATATIVGKNAVRGEGPNAVIGRWNNRDTSVKWTIAVPRDASYTVTFRYALQPSGDGNGFEMKADGKSILKGTVKATKGWGDMTKAEIGVIALPAGEKIELTITPTKIKGGLMNLRAVILTLKK